MDDFDAFVTSCAGRLLGTAYLLTGDLHEAEDLVQETLLKVARGWPKVSRMEHPVAYARRILVNLAIAGAPRRLRSRAELVADQASGPTVAGYGGDETAAVDLHHELVAAVATLPPRQRAVLVLRYFLDLPEAEVAAALQCSLGTVKSTASRALARLEAALRPAHPEPACVTT